MSDETELERVLAELERGVIVQRATWRAIADASRLLRELAADFHLFSEHSLTCQIEPFLDECTCGLYKVRARWRIRTPRPN